MADSTHDEAHTGPIKTPSQLLWAAFFAFVIPVFIIIGLVYYVVSDSKPATSPQAERYQLGGVTEQDVARGVVDRIQKVGSVEIRDANRPLQMGEAVFKAQCAACHATGAAGAPKLADAGAWGARIKTGFEALVASALKGKGAMPAQSGGDFEDTEIARAVAYMANAAGASFAEPNRPAAAAAGASDSAAPVSAAASPATATAAVPAAPVAAAPAAVAVPAPAPAAKSSAAAGEALYKQACFACHAAGVAGAPKFGDKAGWAPRMAQGVDGLLKSVTNGKGAMPPKGGAAAASEAELRAAVEYMVGAVK